MCDVRSCGAIVVESTHVFLRVRREHTTACTRTIYVPCGIARITTYLISITTNCKTISCRPVSTNRCPLACRDQRHCSGGGSAAWALKVLPAYLGLSQTTRDATLSWFYALIYRELSRPRFSCLDTDLDRLFGFWGTPQIWRCCVIVYSGTRGGPKDRRAACRARVSSAMCYER